ncbi:hypothetical protein NPX13_g9672 [Xylaria arbuscula]|uniref:GH16 domain-containing protein n=1 Tax=Xylaria arbuscula TaxID=114810 RepID=A0A9W8N5Z4_9PEZI|nr:hypothetical protein NPX13_g9672 [Xylaria arbuscula]
MRSQIMTLVALGPLVASALPKHHRKCGGKPKQSSTGFPLSDISSFTAVPVESLPTSTYTTFSITTPTTTSTEAPESTITGPLEISDITTFSVVPYESLTYQNSYVESPITTGLPLSEEPSFSAVPAESIPTTSTFLTFTITPSTTPTSASSTSAAASYVVDDTYAKATAVAYKIGATKQCGNDDRLILPGEAWTVANSMYNADQMVGQQCTNFDGILETTEGVKEVKWTSITNIELVEDTKDVCKGYTNIGIGKNLNKKLKDIESIPAYFKWDRTNSTEFRGSNVFDFITAPTEGDGTSTASSEFMLWVRIWGGQVPIGYSRGPVATFDMFGATWKLYEGQNPASGVTVRSMLVDDNYDGVFQGDLKEWLDAMAQKGYIADDEYVTVGNAGTEVFYGKATMEATVALDIN